MHRREVMKTIGTVSAVPFMLSGSNAAIADHLGQTVTLTLSDGSVVSAHFIEPSSSPTGSVVLIHEWWGLNRQIKNVAERFATEGYLVLAVDLFEGKVAQDPNQARALTKNVNREVATETMVAWIDWVRSNPASNGKVGTVGWCFGGGWSLNASIATAVDATVIYYGRCAKTPEETKRLSGPVMGHFATRDKWINQEMVSKFEAAMDVSEKSYVNYWYEADHAFANPTSARHDAEDARLAWKRTLDFLRSNLT